MRRVRHNRKIQGLVCGWLIVALALPARTQERWVPPPLVEGATFLRQSLEEAPSCIETAEYWAKKARASARGYRSSSSAWSDLAGALEAKADIQLAQVRMQREQMEQLGREIAKATKDSRLETAKLLLIRLSGMDCNANLQRWLLEAESNAARARALLEEGDRLVRSDPKKAEKLYKQARKLNREIPDLERRLELARELRRQRRGPGTGRIVWSVFVVGALAATAYGASRQKLRR